MSNIDINTMLLFFENNNIPIPNLQNVDIATLPEFKLILDSKIMAELNALSSSTTNIKSNMSLTNPKIESKDIVTEMFNILLESKNIKPTTLDLDSSTDALVTNKTAYPKNDLNTDVLSTITMDTFATKLTEYPNLININVNPIINVVNTSIKNINALYIQPSQPFVEWHVSKHVDTMQAVVKWRSDGQDWSVSIKSNPLNDSVSMSLPSIRDSNQANSVSITTIQNAFKEYMSNNTQLNIVWLDTKAVIQKTETELSYNDNLPKDLSNYKQSNGNTSDSNKKEKDPDKEKKSKLYN